jgi:hypothetical protein
MKSSWDLTVDGAGAQGPEEHVSSGMLVVNADDWGRNRATTDRTLECVINRSVSAVSSMVFMEDSERAAAIALDREIDAALHLNFTTPFSPTTALRHLAQHQHRVSTYLRRHRFAPLVFHPALSGSFDYLVQAQVDEYRRLYGAEPHRIDGHHHMHLSANVILRGLLPAGTLVRRNFSFRPGEKGLCNRSYRTLVDRLLARRHRLVHFLFALTPLEPASRLQRIFSLARTSVVELEAHPVLTHEYRFLAGGEIFRWTRHTRISRFPTAPVPQKPPRAWR